MDTHRINAIVDACALEGYRRKQLLDAFFEQACASFDEVTTLPKSVRATITMSAMTVHEDRVLVSADGRAHKALLRLDDGEMVESVLLNPKPGHWSCCISSQVGCLMKCSFCATGLLGFTRHLNSEEITDQVLFWRQYIKTKALDVNLRNVVYMGMGEPFHNKDAVFDSLRELTNPETFNIGARNISVSTSGLVPAIEEFTDQFPQINLAVSLHAATDELRQHLMPVNKPYPLAKLRAAMDYYVEQTNRKLFIEYILLDGENDQVEHAEKLVSFVKDMQRPHLSHINLIVYNQTEASHRESSRATARTFLQIIQNSGLSGTIRKNLGRDIDGACGQLALKGKREA
jgi:23S rRNA (adenine(2503)-C(2))-methyltransferase